MLITHNLGVVAEMADDVVVMYLGRVVEEGTVDDIFHDPKHPYTQALLHSIPEHRVDAAGEAADDQRLDSAPVQPADGLPVPSALRRRSCPAAATPPSRPRAAVGDGQRRAASCTKT